MTAREVLTRQVAQILPSREALEAHMRKNKIRLYLGVDPTGKHLHVGHTIALRKLQQFADLGHEAVLVVGTGTVLAGDPSQRESARPLVSEAEIRENMKTWKAQAAKILDFSKVQIRFNGDWLCRLKLPDVIRIASHISASQLFQRDMFQKRLQRGDTVWTHELLYPLLQGYDSVALDVDLEIGGQDQLFNMLVGRELQKKMRNKEKYVLTTPMLMGLDGRPMSKTSGNTVNIAAPPEEMYGKLMSMRDELVLHYAELCTELKLATLQRLSPREAKARLAQEIVALLHGREKAQKAAQEFNRVFTKKELPEKIPAVRLQKGLASGEVVPTATVVRAAGLASSYSQARRLVKQGGVSVDRRRAGEQIRLRNGMILGVGKRRFVRIVLLKNRKTP